MTNFKAGNKIIMLEDCGKVKKGEVLTVKSGSNGTLIVRNEFYSCNCQSKWKLFTKDWDNLAVDDVLVYKDGDKRYVLFVGGRIIFLSAFNDRNASRNCPYTKEELIEEGYTILQDSPETIEISGRRLSKSEVEERTKDLKEVK